MIISGENSVATDTAIKGETVDGSGVDITGHVSSHNATISGGASGEGDGVVVSGGTVNGGTVEGQAGTGDGVQVSGD
ncbi:adhesin, partial [Salmonella enterica]